MLRYYGNRILANIVYTDDSHWAVARAWELSMDLDWTVFIGRLKPEAKRGHVEKAPDDIPSQKEDQELFLKCVSAIYEFLWKI